MDQSDITPQIMDILMDSLVKSVKFHEMKLFFLHQHFDILNIAQLNNLVEIFIDMLHRKELKKHPSVCQFNVVKYALLIYRISWKIERKKIYSLITKSFVLNEYLNKSLENFFEKQQHIYLLHNLMTEPIFHMTEKKDCLDIMLEMKMERLLQNPVVVEVLNLVYEGKYSADANSMYLSQTFQSFFLMEIGDLKSINQRLMANIVTFGGIGGGKQFNL